MVAQRCATRWQEGASAYDDDQQEEE